MSNPQTNSRMRIVFLFVKISANPWLLLKRETQAIFPGSSTSRGYHELFLRLAV